MPAFDSALYMCDWTPCRRIMPSKDNALLMLSISCLEHWDVFWFCSSYCLGRAHGKAVSAAGSELRTAGPGLTCDGF